MTLQSQKHRLEKKMERERIMLAAMPEPSVLILELARGHGRVTMAQAVRLSGSSRKRRAKATYAFNAAFLETPVERERSTLGTCRRAVCPYRRLDKGSPR